MTEREHDVAKSLIAALTEQAQHVDDGSFTLDPTAAFAKLREHQLTDPHAYVLLLVEAAWLAAEAPGHNEVRVDLESTTSVEFSGLPLERGSLRELFAAALGKPSKLEGEALRRARILQLLGLAANSALALRPKQIIVEASDAEGNSQRVRIDPSGALTVEPSGPMDPGLVRFMFCGPMFSGKRCRAERELLEQRCRETRMAIRVNHHLISQHRGVVLDPGIDSISGKRKSAPVVLDERTIGLVGRGRQGAERGRTWIVNRGVAIAEPPPKRSRLRAVVEVDLPTDLSRTRLLEGPELEAVRRAIEDARRQVAEPVRTQRSDRPAGKPSTQPEPEPEPKPSQPIGDQKMQLVLFVLIFTVLAIVGGILDCQQQREREQRQRELEQMFGG